MNPWTKEQTIVALNLYCNIPFNKATNNNPQIIKVAKLLGRSASSVKMKVGNFGSFDPELKKRGIVGLANASKLDKEIWEYYSDKWDLLAYDSYLIEQKLSSGTEKDKSIAEIDTFPIGIEQERIVRTRVNQQFFRNTVLASYNYSCCITGLSHNDLLEACHIVDWAIDEHNRTNPCNGLCLNPLFHKAYDCHYIGITPDYEIKVSDRLFDNKETPNNIRDFFMQYDNSKIILPNRFLPSKELLDIHYQKYLR